MNDASVELILNELIEIKALLVTKKKDPKGNFQKLNKDPEFRAKSNEARNATYENRDKAKAHEVNAVLSTLRNKMGFTPNRSQLSKAVNLSHTTLIRLEKKGYITLKQA